MPSVSPRQVAIRAQEIAFQLFTMLDREGRVARFLRAYANEQKRPGRIANPVRYRDLVESIRREALLVCALEIEAQYPRRLGARPGLALVPAHAELLGVFRSEFLGALGRALAISEEELQVFWRDLELYRRLYAGLPTTREQFAPGAGPRGPFADRCGFLLDSPMLEPARRAASQFERELRTQTGIALKKILLRRMPR